MSTQKYTFCKIIWILPQTIASSPGHIVFLILDGNEHGDSMTKGEDWSINNIHKNTSLISLVLNLKIETFLRVKVLPNVFSWFHHLVGCVKTLHLLQRIILKLVTVVDIFWTERWLVFTCNKYLNQLTKQSIRGFPTLFLSGWHVNPCLSDFSCIEWN